MIDIHTHIFPPDIVNNRGDFFSEDPAFRWLYDSPQAPLATAENLLQAMSDHGVQQSVIFGFPWRTLKLMRRHNDYILEAQHRYPRHLIGFACVNALESGAAAEVERCLAAGCRGVGELAFYQEGLGDAMTAALRPIAELCQGYGVPLLLHANEPVGHAYPGKSPMQLGDLYNLIKAFPDLTLILAHWGGGLFFFNLLKKEVSVTLKNVYFDTAASPYLYKPEIYRLAAEIIGPDKILFGSDYPLLPPSRYLKEMAAGGLPPEHQEMLTRQNAMKILRK
ncbi:MAG: amidohydrolase family protein [Desulfobacterota bacterium]|nr:amidohydrolase family protein [Thermodesulfobacteriota bacterium]